MFTQGRRIILAIGAQSVVFRALISLVSSQALGETASVSLPERVGKLDGGTGLRLV